MKTMSQSRSGVPLQRSLTSLSKPDPLGPARQNQLGGRTSSMSSLSVSKELLKGTGVSRQSSLRAQGTSGGTHRPSFTPRSAQSSPHVLKRDTAHLKNTRDLRRGSLPQDGFRDMEKHSNKNWRSGHHHHHHFTSLDNEVESAQALRKPTNGNVIWETSGVQKQRMRMQARADGDRGMITSQSRSQGRVTHTSPEGRESPRMAAVAPFRFRLQVREDAEASLEDLSDCSSDSMEMCCEDLRQISLKQDQFI